MAKMTRRTFLRGVAATAALPAASTAFTPAPARAATKPFAGKTLNGAEDGAGSKLWTTFNALHHLPNPVDRGILPSNMNKRFVRTHHHGHPHKSPKDRTRAGVPGWNE